MRSLDGNVHALGTCRQEVAASGAFDAVAAAVVLAALVGCAAGAGRVGIVSGGEPRSYLLVAAPSCDSASARDRPACWLGTPEQMARMSGLSSAAGRLGFAVV
jgi:hypothetical protein